MIPLRQGLRRHLPSDVLERLAAARVGIAGAGGLGSNSAVMLVRSGIRRLAVADPDRVEASNLNRQAFFPADLGRSKVAALGDILRLLEPDLEYHGADLRLNAENAPGFFAGCDLVLEAVDEPEAKAGLCQALLSTGFFVIAASGLAGVGGPPLQRRCFGKNLIVVGDQGRDAGDGAPPLAPRVMQAAALQADAALEYLLGAL